MTAPVASGWSGCRVGLAPTGKRRLCAAHAKSGRRRDVRSRKFSLILINESSRAYNILGQLFNVSQWTAISYGSVRRRSGEETRDAIMLIRQLTAAPLLSLALLSLPGAILTANAANPLVYCKEDAARICPGVEPGGGRLVGCLKEHENEVSIGCAKELKAIKAKMGK
jgi:hypothetical protein